MTFPPEVLPPVKRLQFGDYELRSNGPGERREQKGPPLALDQVQSPVDLAQSVGLGSLDFGENPRLFRTLKPHRFPVARRADKT